MLNYLIKIYQNNQNRPNYNQMLHRSILRTFANSKYSPASIFQSRRLLYQHTSQLLNQPNFIATEKQKMTKANKNSILSAYCGYDPTAESLHLGNLVSIIMMARLHYFLGIRPIFLLGGATGLIGDPSGKKEERDVIAEQRIKSNLESISSQIKTIYSKIAQDLTKNRLQYEENMSQDDNNEKIQPIFLNNLDFYKNMNVLTYLRDVGKVLRMNNLLAKETVVNRLQSQSGLSYTQFSYSILQSFDFYVLNRDFGCILQFGGSDQWGNITNGCDLIKKLTKGKGQGFGITMPLLLTKTGQKFGKSQGNALFLNPNKTPLNKIYDYLYSTPDDEVQKLMRIFTLYSEQKIQRLSREHKIKPQSRVLQKLLAERVTNILGSYTNVKQQLMKMTSQTLKKKSLKELLQLYESLSSQLKTEIKQSELLQNCKDMPSVLVKFGLCKSKNEARKDIEGDGIYINNEKAPKSFATLELKQIIKSHSLENKYILLRKGKKKYFAIKFAQ